MRFQFPESCSLFPALRALQDVERSATLLAFQQYVGRAGASVGIEAPINQTLVALVKGWESHRGLAEKPAGL